MTKILFCLFFSGIFGLSNANTQHGDDWRGALETRNSTWFTHEQMRRTDEETENKGNFLTPYSELITFTAVYVVQVFKNYDVDGSGTWEEEEIFEYVTDLLQLNNLDLIHSDTVKNSITGEHGNSDDKHLIFGNVATMLKIESLPFNFSNSADFLAILKYYDEDESEDLKNEEIEGLSFDILRANLTQKTITWEEIVEKSKNFLEKRDVNENDALNLNELELLFQPEIEIPEKSVIVSNMIRERWIHILTNAKELAEKSDNLHKVMESYYLVAKDYLK